MRLLDRVLQKWRIRKAVRWIPPNARVLDIGCHNGELFQRLGDRIGPSVGMDPLAKSAKVGPHRFIPEFFDAPSPFDNETFDAITMLATLEHVPDPSQIAAECARVLRPGGRTIITVPAASVDVILRVLMALRLVEGMELEQHHGYAARHTPKVFQNYGFRLMKWQWFQLGLNNLFVFEKPVGQLPASNGVNTVRTTASPEAKNSLRVGSAT